METESLFSLVFQKSLNFNVQVYQLHNGMFYRSKFYWRKFQGMKFPVGYKNVHPAINVESFFQPRQRDGQCYTAVVFLFI